MSDAAEHDRLLEPLRMALKLEHEGKKFFEDAAEASASRLDRETFEFLAAEEDKHIQRINQFHKSIADSGGTEPASIDRETVAGRYAAFNEGLFAIKKEIEPTSSHVEAYRTALKFENGAEALYARQAEESENEHVREFFQWLVGEEEKHGRILESCLRFAEDPTKWFR